ncbi:MAG: YceH family protein [Planctomycetes bacterium]|nr:YceH family protein [Planctomycetota bacterium]
MPIELSFEERRVLGVLIEKGFTTPDQYPLSLNAVVVGSNQKSCRDPASSLDEEKVLDSLESLRQKGFVTLVRSEGARVDKWKHRFGETLGLEARETAILAELLLRGPQTDGELRQRASRMRPIEALEEVESLLEGLRSRPDPLVERLGPPGRKRGVKFSHRFYPPSERPSADSFPEQGAAWEKAAEPEGDREAGGASPAPAAGRPAAAAPAPHSPHSPHSPYPPNPPYLPSGAPPAPQGPWPAPAAAPGEVVELRREIEALKERIAELEATFVKFLR